MQAVITLDVGSPDSIKQAAKTIAAGMTQYYTGYRPGDVPGNLPAPYYWWEAGAMFGSLVDYWMYTGDTEYNNITTQALLFQVGPNDDYMPPNQTKSLGNDDQSFWAMAAMSAAEVNYPNPPADQPQWLALAQAVFNSQAPRWDDTTCGGGLRWQIFSFNNGYTYKNTISNGCFFNIASRLGRYTGNQTYFDWAEKAFSWIMAVGLLENTSDGYHFYDGSDSTKNCSDVNHIQWTYNAGVYLYGASVMYNVSAANDPNGADVARWKGHIDRIISGLGVFFDNGVLYEVACETNGKCDVDQRSFKAYLSRWMAATIKTAPYTHDTLLPMLQKSAQAAVSTCTGGTDGNQCGLRWTIGPTFDGSTGVGEMMSALEVVQSCLIDTVAGPLTNKTGGTSIGNPNAGSKSNDNPNQFDTIHTADKAGAGIITLMVLSGLFAGAWWMGVKG